MSTSTTASDPSGFITNPPSTIVKVVNTAREDVNGQLGIVVAFNESNGRYLVHNVVTQQTLALKPDNLVKASTLENIKGQYLQIKNDPRVQQKLQEYYDKAKRTLHPMKPEYAAIGVLLLWFISIYMMGFTKTIMITSVVLLLVVLVTPDVMNGASIKTIVQNIPSRSRQAMEETMPFLKGRLSDKVAAAIVILMVIMAIQSIFVTGGHSKTTTPLPTTTTTSAAIGVPTMNEEYIRTLQHEHYKLGYDDAKNGRDFGTSLSTSKIMPRPHGVSSLEEDAQDVYASSSSSYPPYDDVPPPSRQRSFGSLRSILSLLYLGRTGYDLGRDNVGAGVGSFSFQRMMDNARTLEPWKLGMIGFSLYSLVRSIFVT